MAELAIIGGTGLPRLEGLEIERREVMHTPYGEPSGAITYGNLCGTEVAFLPRHGYGHTIPPHMVNYRANLWCLQSKGISKVILTAPGKGDLPNVVFGVNNDLITDD